MDGEQHNWHLTHCVHLTSAAQHLLNITLYSTMQPLVWLPAVVLILRPPAVRWQCDAATSAPRAHAKLEARICLICDF